MPIPGRCQFRLNINWFWFTLPRSREQVATACDGMNRGSDVSAISVYEKYGEVSERLKEHAWKVCIR